MKKALGWGVAALALASVAVLAPPGTSPGAASRHVDPGERRWLAAPAGHARPDSPAADSRSAPSVGGDAGAPPPHPPRRAPSAAALEAEGAVASLELEAAHKALDSADPNDPDVRAERARLAIYEGDCDTAVRLLASGASDADARDESVAMLAEIARGCARVHAALVVVRDDANGVEVRYQNEADQPLQPLLVDTVLKSRVALTRDLGVTWPRLTRITVVRDLLSLSAMTGLPYKAAQTTGTVAVAKWGRVTLLSPRASRHGYQWRDTVAHELTHLAIARATRDRAPLWLHEGVAKREETRWRAPGPFDERPSPEAVVTRGIELKLDLPLDKLGPSIAMLPSADAAMVAYAEVTSFVRYYVGTSGDDALPRLLTAFRDGSADPSDARAATDAALVAASGHDLHDWDARWRVALAARPKEPLPPLFGLGATTSAKDIRELRDLRERVRLAELLYGRGHAPEAIQQLDRLESAAALSDPSVRHLRARALEAGGRAKDGEPLVASPSDVLASYGPWWALRGRWAAARGDAAVADVSFFEALAADPWCVEAACGGDGPGDAPRDPALRPLCEASRARGEPPLGHD